MRDIGVIGFGPFGLRNTVISPGEGVVVREANRQLLRQLGLGIWLRAEPAVIVERLQDDTTRPRLTTTGSLYDEVVASSSST
jgi:shikimate kinase